MTDSTGGVMPGVTVTVVGTGLQQPLVAVTGTTGTYQFPNVPIGTYSVSFELEGFKKAVRPNVIITSGFQAPVDQKLDVGNRTEEVMVSAAPPVVDTKKTTTGATFTKDILENIPSARDPWQIINMTPGVQAGLNVGGSSSGQQVGLTSRGTGANVQWNLEGGSITDLSSNSSPSYFNFDSFEQIQVVNGGGDVSVQSSGLAINLVTKSGSNVFKGSAVTTFENDAMQGQNVTRELFNAGSNGFISGAPLQKILVTSVEYGGPVKKNRLWFWMAADRQDINTGVLNFFDASKGGLCEQLVTAQKSGALAGTVTYDKIGEVVKCLQNDKTVIKDLQWKLNYQLNSANKFQYLFQSDNKYRNARGASANTAKEATFQQTSDAPKGVGYWGLPLPTHSLTHTLIATDKLVFNTMFTYVHGGFYLDYQDVPPSGNCAQAKYIDGSTSAADYARDASCLWMIQARTNRTTGLSDRSPTSNYKTDRHSWEAKTDGTYFLTNTLGGDHSLKFGFGWRRNPIQSFSHYSGGARADMQCVGNSSANCGGGVITSAGASAGYVPYRAVLYRDQLRNSDWWTYNGYIQDSYSRGKFRVNAGLRYDWQQSKHLGGCVAPSVLRPDILPSQCESATQVDPGTGRAIQAFSNFGPRASVTYDLLGNGKTSVHASYSYYFQTKITLADSLNGLFSQPALTWGPNATSGACSGTAGAPCWNDANKDSVVQVNELLGTPTSSNSRFNLNTGVFAPAGNLVDPSTKIGRTREFVAGVQHELIANLAVGVDYIYRKYDRGSASFSVGYEPGSGKNLADLYNPTVQTYKDPVSGLSAPYYITCTGCTRPSGLSSTTMTNPAYQIYHGVDITMNKRFSNRWQGSVAITLQKNPGYRPAYTFVNPTGIEFVDGASTLARYLIKANGAFQLPWDIMVSGNLNINDGATRTLTINGPGSVYGGVSATGAAQTISYGTLNFEQNGTTRLKPTSLLDLGAQKVINFRGGKNRLKLMLDAFNVFNVNTILGFSSNNRSASTFSSPNSIVPPRVFRIGASISF
ncbi:MAG: carboxypeptidase regulatory-like domain-containing protein [Acidobacteria bacterium]|nr:carboxypeptidase regulatory-like domain-containing protein [Acidobacteriota bacterium]